MIFNYTPSQNIGLVKIFNSDSDHKPLNNQVQNNVESDERNLMKQNSEHMAQTSDRPRRKAATAAISKMKEMR